MPEPREYQTEAIVIRKTKLGEADSILTFFTPHRGKIQGFAKSLRKPKSKLAGHLELLTHSLVSFARGRNIDTITGAQTINAFLPLKNDLWLASCGLYVAELVHQFSAEQQENLPLFQLTLKTLGWLCVKGNEELVLRFFELHLVESCGYRPELEECVICRHKLDEVMSYFSPQAGGLLCASCRANEPFTHPVSAAARSLMCRLQQDDCPDASSATDQAVMREVEKTTGNYLRYLLEREPKSAAWLQALRQNQA